jgi:hypothetical protein
MLFAEVLTQGALLGRLASVVEGQQAKLDALVDAAARTARATERQGVRGS